MFFKNDCFIILYPFKIHYSLIGDKIYVQMCPAYIAEEAPSF